MANIGSLITDAELLALVPALPAGAIAAGTRLALLIKFAEDAVQRHCNETLVEATYTDEEIDIERGEIETFGVVSQRCTQFILKHGNVSAFTSLYMVGERKTDGTVDSKTLIDKNTYAVNMKLGVVTLTAPLTSINETSILNYGILTSWPQGMRILLATYVAGFKITDTTIYDVKMAIALTVDYWWHKGLRQSLHMQSETNEMGSDTPVHTKLPEEARQLLIPWCRVRNY